METPARPQRPTEFERWLPTVFFLGVALVIVLVVLLVRSLFLAVAAPTEPAPAPVVAQAPPVVEAPAPQPAQPQVRFTVRPLEPSYTVVAGDTLSGIAQRYNTTTAALRGINNLADDAILSVGQRLILP